MTVPYKTPPTLKAHIEDVRTLARYHNFGFAEAKRNIRLYNAHVAINNIDRKKLSEEGRMLLDLIQFLIPNHNLHENHIKDLKHVNTPNI